MASKLKALYLAIFLLFISESAFSYFDHGTGSLIIQAVVAFFGMVVVYLHRAKQVIIYYIKRIFGKNIKSDDSITELNERQDK